MNFRWFSEIFYNGYGYGQVAGVGMRICRLNLLFPGFLNYTFSAKPAICYNRCWQTFLFHVF